MLGIKINLQVVISLAFSALMLTLAWPEPTKRHPPGILIPDIPFQGTIRSKESWIVDEYTVSPQATFEIDALVLLKERFYLSREAEVAPFDLTLAWGPLSDQSVVDQIKFSHSGRFYRWRTNSTPPVPGSVINNNVANMHLIPADDQIFSELKKVQVGDLVRFTGYLVNVDAADGWYWRTSLTRKDSGGGACEIVWVENIEIIG